VWNRAITRRYTGERYFFGFSTEWAGRTKNGAIEESHPMLKGYTSSNVNIWNCIAKIPMLRKGGVVLAIRNVGILADILYEEGIIDIDTYDRGAFAETMLFPCDSKKQALKLRERIIDVIPVKVFLELF
jgi:hypothetical protein